MKWIQGSLENGAGSYWEMNHTPKHIVTAFELDNDEFQWAIVDPSDESLIKSGSAASVLEAQQKAELAYDTLIVKNPWHFDTEIQAFVAEGDKPDFICMCGSKLALAGMTVCSNCSEQWISWSVANGEKVSKNFARTIMKRDGVILAATRDESEDYSVDKQDLDYVGPDVDQPSNNEDTQPDVNMVDDQPTNVVDDTDEDMNEIVRHQKYTSIDEEFKAGYLYAEANAALPDQFTDEFKVGFIASLQDRLDELTS